MNRQTITKFLVFALLFIGTVEAAAPEDKSVNDKITISGLYNPFANTSCTTIDKYQQGSVKVNYDKRFHKNWEFHSSALYSRSKRTYHEYNPDPNLEDDKPLSEIKNSGYGDLGISFWWDYIRVRVDFNLIGLDQYDENQQKKIRLLPMGGLLFEAGKMDTFWFSLGCLHPEYPYGMVQIAFNGKIKNIAELGGGLVVININHSTWTPLGTTLPTFFLRTKVKITDILGLNAYFNVNPFAYKEPDLMFEGSLGLEFSF